MNPDDQRIAIAKTRGWRITVHLHKDGWKSVIKGVQPGLNFTDSPLDHHSIPDYLNDLNAIHEAILTLPDDAPFTYYLSQIIWETNRTRLVTSLDMLKASPAQLSKAYLECLQLWTP